MSIDRRTLVGGTVASAVALSAAHATSPVDGARLHPVILTTAGPVRGAWEAGAYSFKGIPYGAATGGERRFLPPQRPKPWRETRDALAYGPMAMQPAIPAGASGAPSDAGDLLRGNMPIQGYPTSEDCLILNVWTPAVADGRKRPVMVWCHGGGFALGMANADWHDGANLARDHDVVVVSMNHRLNIFGFLYLGDLGGEEYAQSGNSSLLDIVFALAWVRENIDRFGGDPANVTLFGQSGGGGKVSALSAMPSAKGLFHKAIIMSGSRCRGIPREHATSTAREVLRALDLQPDQVKLLRHLPAQALMAAMARVLSKTRSDGTRHAFGPVIDGTVLHAHPFDPLAPEASSSVPFIVGTTQDEGRFSGLTDPRLFRLDDAGLSAWVRDLGFAAPDAQRLIAAYRASRPGAAPCDIGFAIATDAAYRINAVFQAERLSARSRASVRMYMTAWAVPGFGGRYGAVHGVDVPLAFDNPKSAPGFAGQPTDPRYEALATQMSTAWATFARTGDPNHPGLPHWPTYSAAERATMIFASNCRVENDPFGEDRAALQPLGPRA